MRAIGQHTITAALLATAMVFGWVAGSASRVDAQSSPLPPPFAIGQFLERDADVGEVLYEVKEVRGDWIRVVKRIKGKVVDEQRWINAVTGVSWLHSR